MKNSEKTFYIAFIPIVIALGLMIICIIGMFGYYGLENQLEFWNNKDYLGFVLMLLAEVLVVNYIIFASISAYYEKREKEQESEKEVKSEDPQKEKKLVRKLYTNDEMIEKE